MADTPHPQYEITAQRKSSEPDEHGNLADVWHVHYTSPSGTKSWIKMPAEFYTPRNVHDAIATELSAIEQVHALGDGNAPPAMDTPAA